MSLQAKISRKSPISIILTVLSVLGVGIIAPAITAAPANAVGPYDLVVHVPDALSLNDLVYVTQTNGTAIASGAHKFADDYGSFAVLSVPSSTDSVKIYADGFTNQGETINVKAKPEIWMSEDGHLFESRFKAQGCQIDVHYVATSNANALASSIRVTYDGANEETLTNGTVVGSTATWTLTPDCSVRKLGITGIGGSGGSDASTPFTVDLKRTGETWISNAWTIPHNTAIFAQNKVRIHFRIEGNDPESDYDLDGAGISAWGVHSWGGVGSDDVELPGGCVCTGFSWSNPIPNIPAKTDEWGITFEVDVTEITSVLPYIIHKGDIKNPSNEDQRMDLAITGGEVWFKSGNARTDGSAVFTVPVGSPYDLDATKQKAIWLNNTTIAYPNAMITGQKAYLYYADNKMTTDESGISDSDGRIELTYYSGLTSSLITANPQLTLYKRLTITDADFLANIRTHLQKQLLVLVTDTDGTTPVRITGIQLGGVLDTAFSTASTIKPGVVWGAGGVPTVTVWAPTATEVTLYVFESATSGMPSGQYPMTRNATTGAWSYTGTADMKGKYYTFNVRVYVPSLTDFATNETTDPYSVSLNTNGTRSQFVNLADADLKPAGWATFTKRSLGSIADASIYEMMIRDFSVLSTDIPESHRGGYLAFTDLNSKGMLHLKALARAGLTHLQIGPAYDFVSVNEDKGTWQDVNWTTLENAEPDSTDQRDAVKAIAGSDGFNWGYDPKHYTAPDGSFATDPVGTTRILEFRSMIKGLAAVGLRTTMDVVYNHTSSSGQDSNSVLDKIVPGYYYRLNASGGVETSTCCQNTAAERMMMGKLIRDSILTWAIQYKVDGFRFDLMGHHPKALMVQIRKDLDALTISKNGVDGKKILLFGEGWDFGEVAGNARFKNASQVNMAGTRVGTFDDRVRDAVRGAGAFDPDMRKQGFGSGITAAPNGVALSADADSQRTQIDAVKVGLAGAVNNFVFLTRFGWTDRADASTGYTTNPVEAISYVDAHDNETLYDSITYKLPISTSMEKRIRYQILSMAIPVMGQGIPFTLAGSDFLRSKSLDRDSYNSGDWFNAIDWNFGTNGFGRGVPPKLANESAQDAEVLQRAQELLANPALVPTAAQMTKSSKMYQELLKIRYSSPLFRLATGKEVAKRVKFLNGGTNAKLGLIVQQIVDTGKGVADIDKKYKSVVIVYNATSKSQSYTVSSLKSSTFVLNSFQAKGADSVVKGSKFSKGTFTVPALTVAVFYQTK